MKRKCYECRAIKPQDIAYFSNSFYDNETKISQDNFLLKYAVASPPREKCPNPVRVNHDLTTKYFVKTQIGYLKQVCQQTFCSILDIGQQRVKNVIKRSFINSNLATERRGGNQKAEKYSSAKASVIDFIKSLKVEELHYNRDKVGRQYLSSDLSIAKLYRMHSENLNNVKVKDSYFRAIFNENFNLGFGLPKSDICSTCIRFREEISGATGIAKNNLMTQFRIHKLRAKAFNEILKETQSGPLQLFF